MPLLVVEAPDTKMDRVAVLAVAVAKRLPRLFIQLSRARLIQSRLVLVVWPRLQARPERQAVQPLSWGYLLWLAVDLEAVALAVRLVAPAELPGLAV
jgi:hypothetical protein